MLINKLRKLVGRVRSHSGELGDGTVSGPKREKEERERVEKERLDRENLRNDIEASPRIDRGDGSTDMPKNDNVA